MKVVVIGHSCGPVLGSEPGTTWNWVRRLSERHEVVVVAHDEFRAEVEAGLAQEPRENLRFRWVTLPAWREPWDPTRGQRFIRPHYVMWQRAARRVVSRMHSEERFDVVHHVSWATVSAPPALWHLDVPFVWGPVGGGQTTPRQFYAHMGRSAALREAARAARVRALPRVPRVRRAASRADVVIATNHETARLLKRAGARDVVLLPAAGAEPGSPRKSTGVGPFTVIWTGRALPTKGLELAIEALSRTRDHTIRLLVAGAGPRLEGARRLARRRGAEERVDFLGWISPEDMRLAYQRADALLFTSLRDSFGTAVLEAAALGLPVVALDHQGVGCFLPADAGIKIPVGPVDDVVSELAAALDRLSSTPDLAERLATGARAFASEHSWEQHAHLMTGIYRRASARRSPTA